MAMKLLPKHIKQRTKKAGALWERGAGFGRRRKLCFEGS